MKIVFGKLKDYYSEIFSKKTIVLFIFLVYSVSAFAEKLPSDIKWLTNDKDPVFASQYAEKGGSFHSFIPSFPMTFRVVGPDSNSAFRSAILGNQLSLIGIHPDTLNIIPELATHWAFGKDKKTMYFKLNKKARWSDGVPITAEDFAFCLKFMRSENIIAPWYNDYYAKEIDKIIVYDKYTLAVVAAKADPDLQLKLGLTPVPEHFYKGAVDKDFVKKYNWEIVPNTGPYQIEKFRKGRYIVFKRKKDWWTKDLRYFKNRFNADRVIFEVIRDFNISWEYFKKGKLDTFGITMPKFWHIKSNINIFKNGYVDKIWFFNEKPRSAQGIWLNEDKEIFKDKNVRYAFGYGMNVKKVIEEVLKNDYFRLNQAYVGYGAYTDKTVKAREFNIDKVDFYMKKSGWQRGNNGIWEKDKKRFQVEIVYTNDAHTPSLVVLKEEAKKAGIDLILQKMDSSAAFKKILEKKHEAAWMGWSTSLIPQYWEFFHSINAHKPQTNNITNMDDPEMDALIDAYRKSLKKEERIRLSHEIQQKIYDIGSFVPTFMIPYVREAYWRWIKLPKNYGTKYTDDLFDPFDSSTGGLFWIDEKVYKETKKAMREKKKFEPVTVIYDKWKP